MKKRFVPPQSWYEAMEEERKVKRNLSRLMNSFQHVPSDRSGDSLRNLVTEIEYFNPPESSKEVRSCKGRIKGEQPLKPDESNKQIAPTSFSCKTKKAGKLTTDTINKQNHNSSLEISYDKKLPFLEKKIRKNKLQKDSTNKQRKLDLGCKPETNQLSKEANKMAVNNRQMLNKNSNSAKYKNFHVLDKVKSNTKKSNIGQTQVFGRSVGTSVNRNSKTLSTLQSNKVKKLTTYWNNVLNNDMDQFKSEISSTRSSIKSSKSLECLSERTSSTSTLHIKSRNMSEIDLSTLKHVDKHSTDSINNTESQEKGEISYRSEKYNTRTDHNKYFTHTSSTTSISTEMNRDFEQECETENKNIKGIQQSRSEIEFVVNTNQALKTLERLLRYIKIFPNSSLLSDEVRLPKSVKAMISLLTAALSCDQYEQFWIEISEFEVIHSQHTNSNDSQLIVSPCLPQQGGSGDCCSPQNGCASALVLPNENLIQVSNALKFISLCKEVLWTMYISDPAAWQSRQTGTFSFVYEQTIMVEETDYEDSKDGEEEEEEEDEEEVSIKDLLSAAANTLGELTHSCLQCFRNNWPNSMESTVRTIYYTIVSTLVWWIIFKEIWYAK